MLGVHLTMASTLDIWDNRYVKQGQNGSLLPDFD